METNNEGLLKPFFQRASEAEDRLSRIEAALATKKGNFIGTADDQDEQLMKTSSELYAEANKLAAENGKLAAENRKLAAENGKLQYQISHLVRAVRDSNSKLEALRDSEQKAQTTAKLEDLRL
ncbi:uncharacterized protein LOC126676658 [Mercurialis annua]|uniref:uncharacterized protein LOC126676658 n=1 Tax=Mercurialis annua TaxID=3986 RepID=UPI00215EA537|nr:uncharacterized protein LOC126676658 [Mercurialis annua]